MHTHTDTDIYTYTYRNTYFKAQYYTDYIVYRLHVTD